ncbi:MAG TPA: glutamate--tRNA ligase family protein, partial [Candidatus Nanoarchaeia archaeon]|nr:glutamate--tRNA ligase family protein [Candidatus Nanoarchaeia archaeon]
KNPAMRDFPILRINDSPHPRQGEKYRVWPLMNFAVAIDDHENGVTHTVRGKDHVDNEKRQEHIFDYFSWKIPEHLYIGRINFEGMEVSCSKTRKLIEEGKITSWDDIRIPFLLPLKKRGYQPDAFIKYALDMGVTLNDKHVPKDDFFKTLNAFNKEIIDYSSNRYFFVENPVKIEIINAPEKNVKIALYPEDEQRGLREFSTGSIFYIAKKDFDELKEKKIYRLMDCLNFVKKGSLFEFHSEDYKIFKEKGDKIMHWVPEEAGNFKVSILMPDATTVSGIGERNLALLKEGDVCQLERFGFCRLNKKEKNELVFWFGHR